MKHNRPKLPSSYVRLDLPDRAQYVEKEMRDIKELQDLLMEVREDENVKALKTAAALQTNVPPVKLRKKLRLRAHKSKVLSMCSTKISTGDHMLATVGQDNTVVVWDALTGLKTDAFKVSQGHTLSIATPPNGQIVAVGGLSCTIDLYSVNDRLYSLLGQHRDPYPFKQNHAVYIENEGVKLFGGVVGANPVLPLELSPETPKSSGLKAIGRDRRHLGTLYGHSTAITCQAFVDEYTFGSGAADGSCGMWDVLTGESIMRSYEHFATVSELSTNPNSHFIMASAADDGQLKVWDSRQPKSIMTFPSAGASPLNGLKFHPEGQCIVAGNRESILLFDMRTNSIVSEVGNFGMPTAMSLSESGRLVIVGYGDGTVNILDLLKENWISQFTPHRQRISGMAICGSEVATSSWDTTVSTWKCV
ncbi:Guanine nucleotide-binding protein subunit beta [Wickerhamiella sorbophila]|uniref:Guanine nucleotide-binding protein subunit beta n=1 Tax=Wickerhamiella sorbophila TaxID=45607 RepID=A0A2T0FIC9_9ASCO|nr:Guanine nucleotide-binding protein subunit beta [Wickerhamiella sorbophila]PRT54752.1 Guanine nucleotide-binding protein subunit beta [Wickerhamiella sorbophila]